MARTVMAIVKLVDMPQMTKQVIVLRRPKRIMGFRPTMSDALPHAMAVRLWDSEKTAAVMPAHLATSSLGMPKLRIISGR